MAARTSGRTRCCRRWSWRSRTSAAVGACDVGFSCAYMNTISWRTPTTPLPMEINPRVVFERMFGDGGSADRRRAARHRDERSILDSVTEDAVAACSGGRRGADRNALDEYLEAVREIERRIQRPKRAERARAAARRAADRRARRLRGARR